MAEVSSFATIAEVKRKSGADASSSAITDSFIQQFIMETESEVNAISRVHWDSKFDSMQNWAKHYIKKGISEGASISVINYNTKPFGSVRVAESKMDVLRDSYLRFLSVIRDTKQKGFFKDGV